MSMHPAVVIPFDYHMGLDVALCLGRRGIPVYGIDPDPRNPARVTRHARHIVCPNWAVSEDAAIEFLINFARTLGSKPVLFPVREDVLEMVSRRKASLLSSYEIALPAHDIVDSLLKKDRLRDLALQHGIPIPLTYIPRSVADVEAIATQVDYPVLLKPTERMHWAETIIGDLLRASPLDGKAKVTLCYSAGELLTKYQTIAAHDSRLLIQEVIPGPETHLTIFSSYLNRHSDMVAHHVRHKIRTVPVGYGACSSVRSCHRPQVYEIAYRFLTGIGYQGVSGIEFKLDPRDGGYKLIEVNPRFEMGTVVGAAAGLDLAAIQYYDLLGIPYPFDPNYDDDVVYMDLERDVRAFVLAHRRGALTLRGWLESLRGRRRVYAGLACDDWRPFLWMSARLISDRLR